MKPAAWLAAAFLLNVIAARSAAPSRPEGAGPAMTGAQVVDRFSPLLRRAVGHALWIRLVQDVPSENETGEEARRMAAARFELLSEYLPDFVTGYQYGAEVLERWGGHGDAERLLERGIERTGDPRLRLRLAVHAYIFRDRNYAAAVRHLEALAARPEQPAFVRRLLAQCLEKTGRVEEARAWLRRVVESEPAGGLEAEMAKRDLERLGGEAPAPPS